MTKKPKEGRYLSELFHKGLIELIIDNFWSILHQPIIRTIIISTVIFLFFLFLRKIFTRYIFASILKICHRTNTNWDDKILLAFEKPLQWLIVLTGLYIAVSVLPLTVLQDALQSRLFRSAIIIIIGWALYNLTASTSLLSRDLQEKFKIDPILMPLFSKIMRFIIIALISIVVAREWNFDVNGFIAGLGLGGLAFALAAQDMLANLFAGLVIIMEKPFKVGDWISTPSVEGIVETISFRSTRVRTHAQSLVTIPNSTLAGDAITNYTQMGKRRIKFYLGVTYGTSAEAIKACTQTVKQMLIDHPDIHPETIMVNFENFNDSSLDIFIYCFTNTTNWAEYLTVREDVNLKIMEILEKAEISIAFPSRSIYLENCPANQE